MCFYTVISEVCFATLKSMHVGIARKIVQRASAVIRFSGALIGLAMLLATGSAQAMGLKMTLSDAGNNIIEARLTNESFVTHTILRWETPFESTLTADMFLLVNQDNQAIKPGYTGFVLQRGEVTDQNFFVLRPGEEISSQIKLTDYYQVDADGTFNVTLAGHFKIKQASAQRLTHTDILSNTLQMRLISTPDIAFARPALLQSCSTDQEQALSGIVDTTENLALQSKNAFDSLTDTQTRRNSPRLTTWFGPYDANRFSKIDNTLTRMVTALRDKEIKFNCICPVPDLPGTIAAVLPYEPYEIYLCDLFWSSPMTGYYSKTGTIIHELTHFTVIGGTDDHAYGHMAAKQLAFEDPDSASDNASNYAFFVENSPGIPITANQVQTANGQVLADTSNVYSFSGRGLVTLMSNSGDADLEVMLNGNMVCESENSTPNDACELSQTGDYQIIVYGYTDANYELRVLEYSNVIVQSGGSGGSSGGGGFIGTTSLLSLLVIAAIRFRRKVKIQQAITCSLGVFLLTACQTMELAADNGAASGGTKLKPESNVAQTVAEADAAAILKLDSLQKAYLSAEKVDVVFSLYNNSDEPIRYLPWGTALESNLSADVFAVELEGTELPYTGFIVRRGEPLPADYDILQPGENIEVVINVANSYDMSTPGSYKIGWRDSGALKYQLRGLNIKLPEPVEIRRISQ